jgi:uncharacterized protein (DUF697 family)
VISLSKIAATTAFLSLVLNVAVLFGWDLSVDQIAAINAAIVGLGALIHTWFNPEVPFGPSGGGE